MKLQKLKKKTVKKYFKQNTEDNKTEDDINKKFNKKINKMKSVRIEGEEVVLVTNNLHNTGMLATLISESSMSNTYIVFCVSVCMYVLLDYSYMNDLKVSGKLSLCEKLKVCNYFYI